MSPALSVKNVLTQAGHNPASLRSPAYLSTTASHLHKINVKNFWYLKMFFYSNMANIYEVQVHIPTNISIKKSIF
jgi:hypothetical protein